MYYGSYHQCWLDECQLGFRRNHDHPPGKEIEISCLRPKCPPGQISHVMNVPENQERYSCRPPYMLKPREVELANDNGCHPGFNRDEWNLCRRCPFFTKFGSGIQYYPSDCLHFVEYHWVQPLMFTYSLNEYNHSLLDKKMFYKGFTGEEGYYKILLGQRKNQDGVIIRPVMSFFDWDGQNFITERNTDGFLKSCYRPAPGKLDLKNYKVLASSGYYLELISEDPTGQAQKQVGLYGNNTDLNTFYCRKTCSQGYYYDFDSTSCRRCYFGCSDCQSYKKCDLCIPGFKKVVEPKFTSHKVEKR